MEKAQETLLIGEVSKEQINTWKKQHKEIFAVKAEGHICYLRKPDRKVLSYVSSLSHNPIKLNEALLNNCWLGGSEEFKTNDEFFLGLSAKLNGLVQIKQAELEKL
ncbi:MAG: hypothetical protein K5685_06845 [Bacteroidales bacterium]|nr:hypothetical protein [Bacteroidales bacterium]